MNGSLAKCKIQNGVVLIYALVILLILSLVAETTVALLAKQQQIVSNYMIAVQRKYDSHNALLVCEQQLEATLASLRFHQNERPAAIMVRQDEFPMADPGEFVIDWRDETKWLRYGFPADIPQTRIAPHVTTAECLFVLISAPFNEMDLAMNLMADAEQGARVSQTGYYHFRVFARLKAGEDQVVSVLASDYLIHQSG